MTAFAVNGLLCRAITDKIDIKTQNSMGFFGVLLLQFNILGDKVTVKIGKEGSKELMKKVLKKDQVRDYLYDYSYTLLNCKM